MKVAALEKHFWKGEFTVIGIEPQTTIATLAQHKAPRFALSSDTTTDPTIIAAAIADI